MKTTLKNFIAERNDELKLNGRSWSKEFTNTDSEGVEFTNTVISFGTDATVEGFDSMGNKEEKPVFVNVSLSKAMSEEVGDKFDADWIFANGSQTVEIDPMYPNSAKVIKVGGEDVKAKLIKFLK